MIPEKPTLTEIPNQGLTGDQLRTFISDLLSISRVDWDYAQEVAFKVGGVTTVALSILGISLKFSPEAPFLAKAAVTTLAHLGSPLGYLEYFLGGAIGVGITAGIESLVDRLTPSTQQAIEQSTHSDNLLRKL